MRLPIYFVLALLVYGCAGPFQLRKTKWTVPEVQTWYENYRKNERYAWDGILYQGSDTRYHHFVARLLSVDNWAIIEIKKEDLTLADERSYRPISGGTLGYYYVDPTKNFVRIRDYK